MIEYIDFKIDFTNRNARVGGVTLDRVTTRNYDTAIRFRIEIIGHTLDETYDVKILSKYHTSDFNVMTTLGESLEGADGKVIYTPKVNLITEADYVRNYLYLSKDGLGLDMAQFNYQVDVSHIGEITLDIRQAYDESYEALLAEFEQALEDYKLTLPQADSVRAEIDVVLNQFGMDGQAKLNQYDADAQQAIADNQTAFGVAEDNRQDAYEQAEDNRNQSSNQAVVDWEQGADALVDSKLIEMQTDASNLINGAIDGFNQRGDAEIADWREGADSEFSDWLGDANDKVAEFDNVLNSKADKADLDDLSSLLGWHTAKDVVGLEVDFENKIFTRVAGAVGLNAGSDFDKLRAFGGRRRCILSDSGEALAYHGDANYIEDGSLGQVMVEQPKFYYKVVPLKIEPIIDGKGYHLRKARYFVSDTKQVGFKVHPAFVRNGEELNKIYLSAYEGSLYDVSGGAYNLTDAQNGAFIAGTGDKLSSITNAKPASGLTQGLTRAGARIVAQNRGTGWELMYAATAAATQLLFAIEFGTFNTQTAIGMGVSKTDDTVSNMSDPTGATSALGNASGKAENGSVSYRGEENFWMNIWKWVDGMNIKPQGLHELYVADHAFADDKGGGSYKNAGITMAKVTGYVSAFAYNEPFDWLFMPSDTVGGNSSVPVGDYFYQNAVSTAGWLAALLGGGWTSASHNGGFYWTLAFPSADRTRNRGARLVYAKGGN